MTYNLQALASVIIQDATKKKKKVVSLIVTSPGETSSHRKAFFLAHLIMGSVSLSPLITQKTWLLYGL